VSDETTVRLNLRIVAPGLRNNAAEVKDAIEGKLNEMFAEMESDNLHVDYVRWEFEIP
jgi:hypothetical protein